MIVDLKVLVLQESARNARERNNGLFMKLLPDKGMLDPAVFKFTCGISSRACWLYYRGTRCLAFTQQPPKPPKQTQTAGEKGKGESSENGVWSVECGA